MEKKSQQSAGQSTATSLPSNTSQVRPTNSRMSDANLFSKFCDAGIKILTGLKKANDWYVNRNKNQNQLEASSHVTAEIMTNKGYENDVLEESLIASLLDVTGHRSASITRSSIGPAPSASTRSTTSLLADTSRSSLGSVSENENNSDPGVMTEISRSTNSLLADSTCSSSSLPTDSNRKADSNRPTRASSLPADTGRTSSSTTTGSTHYSADTTNTHPSPPTVVTMIRIGDVDISLSPFQAITSSVRSARNQQFHSAPLPLQFTTVQDALLANPGQAGRPNQLALSDQVTPPAQHSSPLTESPDWQSESELQIGSTNAGYAGSENQDLASVVLRWGENDTFYFMLTWFGDQIVFEY